MKSFRIAHSCPAARNPRLLRPTLIKPPPQLRLSPLAISCSHLRCHNERTGPGGSTTDAETTSASSPSTSQPSATDLMSDSAARASRIQETVAGLNALLGVQENVGKTPLQGGKLGADFKASVSGRLRQAASQSKEASPPNPEDIGKGKGIQEDAHVSISPEALEKMVEMLSRGNPNKGESIRKDITDQVQRVADKARKMESTIAKQNVEDPTNSTSTSTSSGASDASSGSSNSSRNSPSEKMSDREREELLKEFETLVSMVDAGNDEVMSRNDVKRLKEAAFGPQTFWVKETSPIVDPELVGLLIRGNLRADREKVFERVSLKVEELFPGKYETLMVFDKDVEFEYGGGAAASSSTSRQAKGQVDRGPPVAFQIVPVAQARPPPTDGVQQATALVLSMLFVGTCVQLGLAANISKLPLETLTWLAEPANLNSDQLPPGLESWDPSDYLESAAPIITSLIGVNVTHELGHRVAAAVKGVKLGPSYFVPSFQTGCFGAITPFVSLLKDRAAMWDVAAAGPLAGFLASLALILLGLASSDPAQVPPESLVPVPTPLLEGSLLLGAVAKGVLGDEAVKGVEVFVSPLAIAGWYGMVTTALNLLPAGCLDGGRMVQGAFGKSALSVTTFLTYLGLGLGLIGGSLSLPFGLYVILCQRNSERYIKDNVAPAGERRQTATMVALLLATLVLVPMVPALPDAAFGPDSADFL